MRNRVTRLAAVAAISLGAAGCGSECVIPPCAFPVGVIINVLSSAGSTIGNASVEYTAGGQTQTMPCTGGSCMLGGYVGRYDFKVTAPGYAPASLSVTVTGKDAPKCGCTSLDTQHVDVRLTPAP